MLGCRACPAGQVFLGREHAAHHGAIQRVRERELERRQRLRERRAIADDRMQRDEVLAALVRLQVGGFDAQQVRPPRQTHLAVQEPAAFHQVRLRLGQERGELRAVLVGELQDERGECEERREAPGKGKSRARRLLLEELRQGLENQGYRLPSDESFAILDRSRLMGEVDIGAIAGGRNNPCINQLF